jgi:EAL domain-containing protein (putative c-di-GMP-specific phosphodiesterase class I)
MSFQEAVESGCLSIYAQPIKPLHAALTYKTNYFEILTRVQGQSPQAFLHDLTLDEKLSFTQWLIERVRKLPIQSERPFLRNFFALNIPVEAFFYRHALECAGGADNLFLEVTETVDYSTNFKKIIADLEQPVILDDLGDGYASLQKLHEIPFHGFKIGGKLVHSICENPDAAAIVGSLMRIAQDISMSCTMEWVENQKVWDKLKLLQSVFAPNAEILVQGYAVGVPLPALAAIAIQLGSAPTAVSIPPPSFGDPYSHYSRALKDQQGAA